MPLSRPLGIAFLLVLASPAPAQQTLDSSLVSALRWREVGPYRGGRSVAVAGSVQRPWEYYMGTTGGGVFKTTDGGQSWTAITDKYFGGTIGAVAVAPSNPDIVYVGGGEFPIRGNVSHGDGVWRSDDAGKTWRYLGLKETQQIARVRVHPANPDIVWVAAQGKVWVADSVRGVYKSTDGGKTWKKKLFRNDSTGAADLSLDPANPNVLYAGLWHAGRKPWQLISGGVGSGLFKSMDGGETWTEITRNAGLPRGLIGNVGISASAARRGRVYAILEADSGGVFKSDDAGATWVRTNDERKLRQRAWYYMKLHADPQDSNTVYVNNVGFHRSTDGGKTFRPIRTPHVDSHDLWIAPNDNKRLIEGNDGGANVSFNAGLSWSDQDFATAQFYHVTTTNHFPYKVCGAQQDNSTVCGPSRKEGGIDIGDWEDAGGGESGYIAVRPDDPDIVFAGSYGGFLTRKDMTTGIERNIHPWPDNPMGHPAGALKYRFQWTFPIVVSPHDPNVVYAGSSVLFRTVNEGQTWTAISPDLTRNDPTTLVASGGPITKDQTSVEYYGTIFTIAESPALRGVIWTGSDDGFVQLTRDVGRSWTNVTPRDMERWTRVSMIEASRHAAGTAYVAANRYQLGDFRPYIWKTTNFGQSWTRIDTGIAADEFVRVVREDPERRGLLYAGTERGVWFSLDDGASWQKLQLNLPPVPIHDLAVKEGDLVAGTHGRSFWILDDLSVLRQANPSVATKAAHLYRPRDAWRVSWGGSGGGGGGASAGNVTRPRGANPQSGALVWYNLREAGKEVVLEFLDARGTVIRSFTSRQDSLVAADSLRADARQRARIDSVRRAGGDTTKLIEQRSEETSPDEGPRRAPPPPRVANKKGLNSFVWNLRHRDASTFDDMILWAGNTQGPLTLPGTYRVRMKVDGETVATDSFRVRKDPRTKATLADLREQFALLVKIRDRVTEANDAVKQIRSIKQQLDDREQRAGANGARGAGVIVFTKTLREAISAVEDSIYQTKNRSNQDPLNYPIRLNNKIAALTGVVASTDARPTDQSYAVFNTLSMQLDIQLATLKRTLDTMIPRLNTALAELQLPAVDPKAPYRPSEIPRPAVGDDEVPKVRRW